MFEHVGSATMDTERLVLRPFDGDDVDATLRNWAGDERVQKPYGEPVYPTREAVSELLAGYIQRYDKGDYYRWVIDEKNGARSIGQIAFFLVDTKNHFAEIEYCIGVEFQDKGYATEATRAVIEYGFQTMGLNKVQICHNARNPRSKRVIEKCGFTHEGTLRDYFLMDGEFVDRLYYSILAREF
jgi:[ribosomal protein S5]-alanine N-acetyltransferase